MTIKGKVQYAREWVFIDVEKIERESPPESQRVVCDLLVTFGNATPHAWMHKSCLHLPKAEKCPHLFMSFAGDSAADFAAAILRALRTLNAESAEPQEVPCNRCGRPGMLRWRSSKPQHGIWCQNVDCPGATVWHNTEGEAWAQWGKANRRAGSVPVVSVPEFQWVTI